MPDVVTLRHGQEVLEPLVVTMINALRHVFEKEPFTLVDAVEWAHTGEPQAFSATRLEALGFIQQGQMHQATREIILSATEGRGFAIHLVDPIKRTS